MPAIRIFQNPHETISILEQSWRESRLSDQKLIVEIGAGVGLHAIRTAQQRSDAFIIAIEKTREKFTKFSNRLQNHELVKNCYPVHANACDWIAQHLYPDEIDEVFILYPNPYPKEKQANKRWMNMPFMRYLIQTMRPGASLTLCTNRFDYYEQARQRFLDDWGLFLQADTRLGAEYILNARTHFEKKYLQRGEICYELVFKKTDS